MTDHGKPAYFVECMRLEPDALTGIDIMETNACVRTPSGTLRVWRCLTAGPAGCAQFVILRDDALDADSPILSFGHDRGDIDGFELANLAIVALQLHAQRKAQER